MSTIDSTMSYRSRIRQLSAGCIVYTVSSPHLMKHTLLTITIGQPGSEAEVSWWPQQSTWLSSGFYVGYWTSQCEEWYQNHLKEIGKMSQKALRTASEWKSALKQHKKTRVMYEHLKRRSDSILETLS